MALFSPNHQEPLLRDLREDAASAPSSIPQRSVAGERQRLPRRVESARRRSRLRSWWRFIARIPVYARRFPQRAQAAISISLVAGLPRAVLDAAIANSPRALGMIQQLRLSIAIGWTCSLLPVMMQIWCIVRAWQVFHQPCQSNDCTQLRNWLYGFALTPFIIPCCFIAWQLFIVWWCFFVGNLLQARLAQCREEAPALWQFVNEAKQLTLCACATGLVAVSILIFAIRLHVRIRNMAQRRGPTPDNIIAQIPILLASEVDAARECPICLDCVSETSADLRWMRLPCGHTFHEDCLKAWLAEAQACPLCRRYLGD